MRPSSSESAREASETSELCLDLSMGCSSSSESGWDSSETLVVNVGVLEARGEVELGVEECVEALSAVTVSEGWRRHSGYSSSKRWIMP